MDGVGFIVSFFSFALTQKKQQLKDNRLSWLLNKK
jgi:hypothetical protein